MNKNFLNNQNYILGKAEKKKLLSKFFVENRIIGFYKQLTLFLNFFSIKIIVWIIILIISYWLYISWIKLDELYILLKIYWIIIILLLPIYIFYKQKRQNIKNKNF